MNTLNKLNLYRIFKRLTKFQIGTTPCKIHL